MSDAHAVEADVYEPTSDGAFNGKLGMWLFLCSEVMFFSGFLGAYMTLRIGHPETFEAAQKVLHDSMWLAAFNTVLLISSSLTMALAVHNGQKGRIDKQRLFLLLTALMGTVFLCNKVYEYSVKIQHGHIPSENLFFAFYYGLTGIHALHILGGVIPIMGLWFFAKHRNVARENEMIGLYWHFVDLVWIFLFPMLYLI